MLPGPDLAQGTGTRRACQQLSPGQASPELRRDKGTTSLAKPTARTLATLPKAQALRLRDLVRDTGAPGSWDASRGLGGGWPGWWAALG